MEKIALLIDKLQELKDNGADLNDIAYYTQMLYAELMCAKNNLKNEGPIHRKKVSVIMPGRPAGITANSNYEVLEEEEMPEKEIHAVVFEVTEAKPAHQPESRPRFQPHAKPQSQPLYNNIAANNPAKELNEVIAENKPSLNDKLKREKVELATKLNESVSVRDLAKVIDINAKFLFINELFRGDRNMYERSIKTINDCSDSDEAAYWMERELKIKLGWQDNNEAVLQFYQLVKKRFS